MANHYLAKNHRFVIQAFKAMHRSDATLLIVGSTDVSYGLRKMVQIAAEYFYCRFNALLHPTIKIADGQDRHLVVSAYKNAQVFLFGSKVECAPLVMYESFAAGVPFVTTDVGNVRDHEEAVTIIGTPEEMAAAALGLLGDPAKLSALRENGKSIWRDGHEWETIVDRYEALFKSKTS